MEQSKKQFFAFLHQYGLMEFEGAAYAANCVICEGNSMDELIEDYCQKTNTDFDLLRVDDEDGYYDWGFPILFIRICEVFQNTVSLPQLIDFKRAYKNPFLVEQRRKFLGWVEHGQYTLNKDIERGADKETISIDKEMTSYCYFGIYEGYNMRSLMEDFREKNNFIKNEKYFTKQNKDGAYLMYEGLEEEYVVFAPVNDSCMYDENGNKLPLIGKPVINPFK